MIADLRIQVEFEDDNFSATRPGRRLIDSTAKKLADEFLASFGTKVGASAEAV